MRNNMVSPLLNYGLAYEKNLTPYDFVYMSNIAGKYTIYSVFSQSGNNRDRSGEVVGGGLFDMSVTIKAW